MPSVTVRGEWHQGRKWPVDYGQRGGDMVVAALGWRIRFAIYVGSPPGSHIGLWRTRLGSMRGINLRIGRRYIGPCATLLIHTRPLG